MHIHIHKCAHAHQGSLAALQSACGDAFSAHEAIGMARQAFGIVEQCRRSAVLHARHKLAKYLLIRPSACRAAFVAQ